MRKLFYLRTIILAIMLSSCINEKVNYNPKNHLKKFSKIEVQTFNLYKLESKEIIAKNGTKIFFNRTDFNISENDSIILKLKEIYSFDELILNNINTITDNNELLESSGVIKINFYSKDKEIHLKKNRTLRLDFPNKKLINNNIYSGIKDSLGEFTWKREKQKDTIICVNYGTPNALILADIKINIDSINNYEIYDNEQYLLRKKIVNTVFLNNLNWINLDRIINEDSLLTFNIKSNIDQIDNFLFYITYDNLNSFISEYRKQEELNFKNLKIKGETSLIVLACKGKEFYSDKVFLKNIQNDSEIKLNLNKTSIEEFFDLVLK